MSRYDFIRFGGFVNWADEDTDTFRKMKVCLPVKEPVEDDTKIGLISTDEDNPEEIAVSYSVRAAELIPWTDSFQEGYWKALIVAEANGAGTDVLLPMLKDVDLSSGKELFSKAIGNWTNNIGEFLGIVEAVRYVMEHPESPRTIYSDSITAITWYRNKQTASSRRCPALQKAEIFLKVMEARIKDIEVLHWDNRLWGEIPADFGNK